MLKFITLQKSNDKKTETPTLAPIKKGTKHYHHEILEVHHKRKVIKCDCTFLPSYHPIEEDKVRWDKTNGFIL